MVVMSSSEKLGFKSYYISYKRRILLTFMVCLWRPEIVSAQTATLTSPLAPVVVGEGDDYATRVLRNPWDMNESSDIGWEEGFNGSSVNVGGGIWQATNSLTGAYILPLFPDFKGALATEPLPGDKGLPTLGIRNPIDASKYSYLCYRLYNSNRSSYAIYWSNDPNANQYWPDGTNKAVRLDGIYTLNNHILRSGWEIYCHNMKNTGAEFEQIGGSWSGNIIGLRIDPSVNAQAGATTAVDWVRLVDPDSSAKVNISWNHSGVGVWDVVTVYLDTDNSGYNGTPMFRWSRGESPGTVQFPTAALPPGSYNFYIGVQRYNVNGTPSGSENFSGYSAAVTVRSAPQGYFSAPSMTSGDEYFSREAGNPVDMSGDEDMINLASNFPPQLRQFSNYAFIDHPDAQDGKVFQAQADPPLPGNLEGDNQIWLPVNQSKRIDPSHYRYFAYRMFADPSQYSDLSDRVNRGWVSRPVWWNGNNVVDNANSGDPGAAVTRTGWQNYAIDLAAIPSMWRGQPWQSFTSLQYLRFDPLENPVYTWFWVDWVRLYSENRTSNNEYTISFNVSDADSANVSVALYYDNNNSGFDGSYITTMSNLSAGNHSFVWNTSGLTVGNSYYIYMVVSDGLTSSKFYSPVHVKIGDYSEGGGVGQGGRIRSDHNGDGASEVCFLRKAIVKRRASNKQTQVACKDKFGTSSSSPVLNVGLSNSSLVDMDLDGDGKGDWAVINQTQNSKAEKKRARKGIPLPAKPQVWNIQTVLGAKYKISFGQTGDIPVPADYYGSGSDNIAVFRGGWWYIRKSDGSIDSVLFGQSGDIPATADYDGDGKTDIAIFRPSTGEFWFINSSDGTYGSQSFGGSGDLPVPQDLDGDGEADFVVWRSGEARYYVKQSSNSSTYPIPLGGGSDRPMKHYDLDGDGKMDLVQRFGNSGSYVAQTSGAEMPTINVGNSSGQIAPETY